MAKSELHKIKVKSGRNLIEVQGDRDFTEKVFDRIKEIFPKVKPSAPKKRGPKPKPKPSIDLKSIEMDELLEKVKDRRANLRVLVSGFILNKKLRKREFRSKEMKNFMEDHGMEVPDNLTYYFRKMKDDGLFALGRKNGRFKITEEGMKHIEKKLE
jgi:hypothetical protein